MYAVSRKQQAGAAAQKGRVSTRAKVVVPAESAPQKAVREEPPPAFAAVAGTVAAAAAAVAAVAHVDPALAEELSSGAAAAGAAVAGAAVAGAAAAGDSVELSSDFVESVAEDTDWFTPFVEFNAGVIDGIDSVLEDNLNLPNSFGFAIIGYTVLIKAITFPLNQSSLRTNAMMQLVGPKVKQIQTKYANDQETQNRMMLRLYDDIGVNPLGGCLPSVIQLPVFISLYRAINLLAAKGGNFTEAFLWIPSLAGPVDVGQPSLDWLIKSKSEEAFEPVVGWETAARYCILPVILVASQFITQKASAPQQSSSSGPLGAIIGIFPLFIGYTSLVSPAGLGIYWLTNNLLTQAQTQFIRNNLMEEFPEYKRMIDGTAQKEAVERLKKQEEKKLAEANAVPVGLGKGFNKEFQVETEEEVDKAETADVAAATKELPAPTASEVKARKAKRMMKSRRRRR